MNESSRCQQCDVPLTGQVIGGLCANCLLKLALEPPAESATAGQLSHEIVLTAPSSGTRHPPRRGAVPVDRHHQFNPDLPVAIPHKTITMHSSTLPAPLFPDHESAASGHTSVRPRALIAGEVISVPRAARRRWLAAFDAGRWSLLLLAILPVPVCALDFTYSITGGTVSVTRYTGPGGQVAIPDIIAGLPVTAIGRYAFSGNAALTDVTFPNGVTGIGDHAFDTCTSLLSITLPTGITSIGESTFEDCISLTSITLPAGLRNIGEYAFACSNLTGLTLPAGLVSIGIGAFSGCPSLTEITIPAGVTMIADYAFDGCRSLTGVVIPNSVTSIRNGAFRRCGILTSVTIPGSVTFIAHHAFDACTSLTSVYFEGNAPAHTQGGVVFGAGSSATVYYPPGRTGWGTTYGGQPAVLWNPQIANDPTFGMTTDGVGNRSFGFTINGAPGWVVKVKASTNLAPAGWTEVATVTLNGSGSFLFRDPGASQHPARFYRLSMP